MNRRSSSPSLAAGRLRQTYRAILRREPTVRELAGRRLRNVVRGGWPRLLRDMVESEEFRLQILPGLVVTGTELRSRGPVFFLHIPKTGGTSVRLALGEAIGVPSINIYGRWPQPDRDLHRYWPYWAGHAQAAFFPDTHIGFTLFREPRSRVLSAYRHHQFLRSSHRLPHGWDHPDGDRPATGDPLPFVDWLADRHRSQTLSIARFFLPPGGSGTVEKAASVEQLNLLDASSNQLKAGLARMMRRFGAAAWIHDNEAVTRAIGEVAGHAPRGIPRENVGERNNPDIRPVNVDEHALAVLEEVAALDAVVFDVAASQGLLPPLDSGDADRLFQATAERLGFVLPT